MPSKKLTSALVATLLLSHTVLAPLAAVAQEQDVTRQVQETQRQSTDDSQATSLPETPTTSPSSEVSSNTSSDSVNEEAGQETPTQDDSQMQTETSESVTVADTGTSETDAQARMTQLSDWLVRSETDDYIILGDYKGTAKDITIPGEINGKQVYIEGWDGFSYDGEKRYTKVPEDTISVTFQAVNGKKVKVHNNTLMSLFSGCSDLQTVDFSGLDTNNVTSFYATFWDCPSLTTLIGAENLVGPSATNLHGMFLDCYQLADISFAKTWDTSNVEQMHYLFYNCSSLNDISALSTWDVSKAKNMQYIFASCSSLSDISALKDWSTENLTALNGAFSYCRSLSDISPLAGWNTKNLQDMSSLFSGDSLLTDIDPIQNWVTDNVTRMWYTFEGTGIETADLSRWNVSKVTDFERTFSGTKLKVINLSGWHLDSNPTMKYMFNGITNLLVIAQDEKLKSYDYAADGRYPLVTTFEANGGQFTDGTNSKTINHPYVISDTNDATITGLLETAKVSAGTPSKVGGYAFDTWVKGSLPAETNPLLATYNELMNTYTAKWIAWNLEVPTDIDFGTHKRTLNEKTYKANTIGKLQVNDDRGRNWQVTAKLTQELMNANGDKMLGALHYQAGGLDRILSSTSAIDIASGNGTTNLSKDWSDTEGLLLKVDSSKYKPGEYTSTIEWTLNDAP